MKKIFLIAVVLLMMINFIINYHHEVTKEQHTPMADFKTKVEMAPMKEYNDPDFGYVVKYPCFFQQEDTSVSGYQGYARFSFTNHANIILESYVTPNYSNTLQACADSLAQKLHSERTMQASNKAFILSGPVYENGVRVDGYSHYDKFIKSGKNTLRLFPHLSRQLQASHAPTVQTHRRLEGFRGILICLEDILTSLLGLY